MSKKVGRKKNEITEETKQEAQEILDLAFKDVGCIKSKITYNYVSKFNSHIANNPDYIRKNGEYFNDLGVRFWSKSYNNKPYYGKIIIDKLKSTDDVNTGGESFDIDNKDIESLINRYHNKPEELKKRMINLFLKDRKTILDLRDRNDKLTEKVKEKEKYIKQFEEGFATIFWNSTSTYNSLNDVLTLQRPEDGEVNQELLNMFNQDKEGLLNKFNSFPAKYNTDNIQADNKPQSDKSDNSGNNVLSLHERLKKLGLSSSDDDGL